MVINTNISSIFANRQLTMVDGALQKDIEKLSSGMRINTASDDASGLAVSEKMRAQIRGTMQAMRNTQDGVSFLQTTEGYLDQSTAVLQRMRELSIQAANEIYTDEDRGLIETEIKQLVDEIDRIANFAQFNGYNMLTGRFAASSGQSTEDGAAGKGIRLHIGPNQDQNVSINIDDATGKGLGVRDMQGNSTVSLETSDKANSSIGMIDQALGKVLKQRTDIGALQNRVNYIFDGLYKAYENLQASESRIRDANMARQSSEFVKNEILLQSATAMLAHANFKPQLALRLLV